MSKSITITRAAQPTLTISNSSLTGTAGTAITVTISGGSAGGTRTITSASSGCTISGMSVSRNTSPGTCTVTASNPTNGIYLSATSAPVIFTFNAARQSALSITTSNSSNYAKGTTGVSLTTSGGSGSGAISYLTPSAGCTISGSRLTVATSYGSGTTVICSVIANKAANGIYMANTTVPAKDFSFR